MFTVLLPFAHSLPKLTHVGHDIGLIRSVDQTQMFWNYVQTGTSYTNKPPVYPGVNSPPWPLGVWASISWCKPSAFHSASLGQNDSIDQNIRARSVPRVTLVGPPLTFLHRFPNMLLLIMRDSGDVRPQQMKTQPPFRLRRLPMG